MFRLKIITVTGLVYFLINPRLVYSQAEPFISFNAEPGMYIVSACKLSACEA